MWDFASEPIPDAVQGWVEELHRVGAAYLQTLIDTEEIDALVRRAERLVERGSFPEPGESRRSHPWPLV
jgi:hypothetical protein